MQQKRRSQRDRVRRRREERREEKREWDEGTRGTSVVLYMSLVDVYVHRMKMVVSGIPRPGSASAKRIAIRVSSSVFSFASIAHTYLCLADSTMY
jgi:hypothetical protein